MTPLEKLAAEERKAGATAVRLYRDVLARYDTPAEGDTARLRECMATLGLRVADVEQDLATLREARGLEAQQVTPAVRKRLEKARDAAASAARDWYASTFAHVIDHVHPGSLDSLTVPLTQLVGASTLSVEEQTKLYEARERVSGDAHQALRDVAQADREADRAAERLAEVRAGSPRLFGAIEGDGPGETGGDRDEAPAPAEPAAVAS